METEIETRLSPTLSSERMNSKRRSQKKWRMQSVSSSGFPANQQQRY